MCYGGCDCARCSGGSYSYKLTEATEAAKDNQKIINFLLKFIYSETGSISLPDGTELTCRKGPSYEQIAAGIVKKKK